MVILVHEQRRNEIYYYNDRIPSSRLFCYEAHAVSSEMLTGTVREHSRLSLCIGNVVSVPISNTPFPLAHSQHKHAPL